MTSYDNLVFQIQSPDDVLSDAMEFTLKYGKYREMQMKDICLSHAGREYLRWMQSDDGNFNQQIKDRIRTVLTFCASRI